MNKPKALVTGANGFVGAYVVDLLVSRGFDVTILIRQSSNLKWLKDKSVKMNYGDLRDINSLTEAVKDQNYIFHIAAIVRAVKESDFDEINVQGTANLIQAIKTHNPSIKRVIFVSSQEAGGPASSTTPLTENDPAKPVSAYGRSKLACEQLFLDNKSALPVCILRPGIVYGPRDTALLTLFKTAIWKIKLSIGFRDQYISIVHVKDLANAIYLCATQALKSGAVYYVTDGNPTLTSKTLQSIILEAMGKSVAIPIYIPVIIFYFVCLILHGLQQLVKKAFWINLTRYHSYTQPFWLCDSSKIMAELGYKPEYTVQQGIKETLAWYKANNWI